MLIRLIAPKLTYTFGIKLKATHENLTLMYLAALTPSEFDVEITDESISEITYDKKADIIGISFTGTTYSHAYEIAENYKQLGVPVIFGGFHTSLYPEEALEHADAIVVGEAEHVWEELLSDFKKGKLKRVYKSNKPSNLKNLPFPRYDFYNHADFHNVIPIFATRGCPQKCSFCCIRSAYGSTFRKRPIKDVVDQIQFIKKTCVEEESIPLSVFFIDDNIWGDAKYAKELFQSLIPLKISWSIAGASLVFDDELLELAAKSGCKLIFMGFESLNIRNLNHLNKKHNKPELYEKSIEKMHQQNIAVGASFMVGLPYDDQHCFNTLTNFIEKNHMEAPQAQIFIPIPGTEEFNKTDWEGKTECKDYRSLMDVIPIYTPPKITKKQFKHGFINFNRKIYSDESIDRRLENCDYIGCYYMNKYLQKFFNDPEWDKWAEK